jgi:hypothetical protein
MGQVALLYLFAGLHKTDALWWSQGDALRQTLGLEELTRPWARGLRAWPGALRAVTWATMALEILGPAALLSPRGQPRLRTLAVLGFMGLHVGIVAMMTLGPFPFICLGALTTLLPGELWDGGRAPPAPEPGPRWELALGGMLLGYVTLWNVATHPDLLVELAPGARAPGYLLRLDQSWNVFAPAPGGTSFWWVLEAEREDGSRVDLLTGRAPDFEPPADLQERFSTNYHQRFWHLVRLRGYDLVRGWLPERLARATGADVVALRVHQLHRAIPRDHRTPPTGRTLVAQWERTSRSMNP